MDEASGWFAAGYLFASVQFVAIALVAFRTTRGSDGEARSGDDVV